MLLSFRVANHKSVREELELPFVRSKQLAPAGTREVAGFLPNPVTAIYGANASGKSNLLDALAFFSNAVRSSFSDWGPDDAIPVQPFLLDPDLAAAPTLMEVQFLHDGVRYQYGFEIVEDQVLAEWLYSYPKARRRLLFERDGEDGDDFRFGESLRGENRMVASLTRDNALLLSTALSANHHQLSPLASSIGSRFWYARPDNEPVRFHQAIKRASTHKETRTRMLLLVRAADLGVHDLEIHTEKIPATGKKLLASILRIYADEADEEVLASAESELMDSLDEEQPHLQLRHLGAAGDLVGLPLDVESRGTRALIALAIPVLDALRSGGVLLVDELESSLHPNMVRELVRLLQDPETNTGGAQLIFTTHDTTLMDTVDGFPPTLDRDQVWMVEKDREGGSWIMPLSDFRVRKEHNVRRGYLQGRYGGVPLLDQQGFDDFAERGPRGGKGESKSERADEETSEPRSRAAIPGRDRG